MEPLACKEMPMLRQSRRLTGRQHSYHILIKVAQTKNSNRSMKRGMFSVMNLRGPLMIGTCKGTNYKMDWGRRSLVRVVTLALVLKVVHKQLPRLASLHLRKDNSRQSKVALSKFQMISRDCLPRSLRTS